MKRLFVILLVVSYSLLLGCSSTGSFGVMETDSFIETKGYAGNESQAPVRASLPMEAPSSEPLITEDLSVQPPKGDSASSPDQLIARKKVYNGYCFLEVTDMEQTKDTIKEYIQSIEGYIEASYDSRIILRVPAAEFQDAFQWLLLQGHVLNEQVETRDVTEQFSDLEIRLTLAEQTKERLYQLLDRTTDVEERLRILREIRRLSEEIESIKQIKTLIEKSIQFSRIDVQLQSVLQNPQNSRDEIPFPWIRNLTPGFISLHKLDYNINLQIDDNFAVFENISYFYAESFNGIRISAGSTENTPKGDVRFWQKALKYHLKSAYAKSEIIDAGTLIKGVVFESYDLDPFIYEVYIAVTGENIIVFEIFYPDRETYKSAAAGVRSILEGVDGL